jgi:hypothetical protein
MMWWVVNITLRLLYPKKELQINPAGMKASRQWPCVLVVNVGRAKVE